MDEDIYLDGEEDETAADGQSRGDETADADAGGARMSRHGLHGPDTRLLALWMPTIDYARLRHLAREEGMSVAKFVRMRIGLLDGVRLTDEENAWVERERAKGRARRY